MNPDDFARMRSVLDRMVREKEITAGFFTRVAETLDDVDQRGWFRRMAQDERDQRKILMKHRRELCGKAQDADIVPVSAVHEGLGVDLPEGTEYQEALRLAVLSAEQARQFCAKASAHVRDRSCRIFLKILSEETVKHRKRLLTELRRVERQTAQALDEVAA